MFGTIIVGVDGHEGGRDALALAECLRRPSGGELVTVIAYPYESLPSRGSAPAYAAIMHEDARDALAGEIERAGVTARTVVAPDRSPGRLLQLTAQRRHADLIVVGSAHRGRVGRVLAGDATAGTLHGSPCPVAVAPRGYAGGARRLAMIGAAFDGSPESHAAVELARALAVTVDGRLRVISVVEPSSPAGGFPAYQVDWAEQARARRSATQTAVDGLVADLGEIATGEVFVGEPVRELARAGGDLDLLVTGSRGYGPVRRLMLGSTSTRLVHEAPCPVLVLTRGAEEEGDAAAEALTASANAS